MPQRVPKPPKVKQSDVIAAVRKHRFYQKAADISGESRAQGFSSLKMNRKWKIYHPDAMLWPPQNNSKNLLDKV